MARKLTSNHYGRLVKAIHEAFVLHELTNLLQVHLDQPLADITLALDTDMPTIIRKVVDAAQRQDWILELIRYAHQERCHDQELKALHKEAQPMRIIKQIGRFNAVRLHGDKVMVNRDKLRMSLQNLDKPNGKAILVVDGERFSGKTHSYQLIRYLYDDPDLVSPPVLIDLERLALRRPDATLSPEILGKDIALKLNLGEMPSRHDEQDANWAQEYGSWFMGKLQGSSKVQWLVLDGFKRATLTEGTRYLIEALAWETVNNLPNFRLILLDYNERDRLSGVIPGSFEYEYINSITEHEIASSFLQEYQARQDVLQIAYQPDDVTQAVARVWRQIDPTDPKRLARLEEEMMHELKRLYS